MHKTLELLNNRIYELESSNPNNHLGKLEQVSFLKKLRDQLIKEHKCLVKEYELHALHGAN